MIGLADFAPATTARLQVVSDGVPLERSRGPGTEIVLGPLLYLFLASFLELVQGTQLGQSLANADPTLFNGP